MIWISYNYFMIYWSSFYESVDVELSNAIEDKNSFPPVAEASTSQSLSPIAINSNAHFNICFPLCLGGEHSIRAPLPPLPKCISYMSFDFGLCLRKTNDFLLTFQ